MKILPSEDGARMGQVEVKEMTFLLDVIQVAGIVGESIPRGDVMVENDDLLCDVDEFVELGARGCDVDERDERILAIPESDAILMSAGYVPSILAPGLANGPCRAEAVGAAGMIKTEFLQDGLVRCWRGFKSCPMTLVIGLRFVAG